MTTHDRNYKLKKKLFFLNLNSSYYCPLHSAVRGARTTRPTLARPLVTPADDLQGALNPRGCRILLTRSSVYHVFFEGLFRSSSRKKPKSPFEYHATYTWSSPLLLLNVIHSLVLQKLHISLLQH